MTTRSIATVLALVVAVGTGVAAGSDREGDELLARGLASITAGEIAGHVEILASDEFAGRAPATAGEKKTLEYITRHFKKAGLTPGPDGGYLQQVPMVSRQVRQVERMRVTGNGAPLDLVLGDDMIVGTGLVRETVELRSSELVFAGYGIVAPEYGWDDYGRTDVRGKTVIVLLNDPGRTSPDSTFFKGRALTFYGTIGYKQEEAARRGAKGIVVIHDPDIAGYPWEVVGGSARQPKFALVPDENTTAKPELFVLTSRDAAARVLEKAGRTYEEVVDSASRPEFRAFDMDLALTARVHFTLEHSDSYNVIGMLPGRERPDEFVLYTAHWDHVGIGAPVDGDSIYNGAIDNATGTAVLLELADAYAALPEPPARSVVFFATAAEEQGLLGAFYYADHPLYPLERTAAAINMDALFPFGDFNGMTVVAMGSSEVEVFLEKAATANGRTLQPDPSPEFGAFFRSDHYPLAKKGVPAIFAVGGPLDDPEPPEEMVERFNKYMVAGYHKPQDEYGDDWDMRGILGDARIYFQTGYAIAQDERFPNWYLDHEFRATRDRSRAERLRTSRR